MHILLPPALFANFHHAEIYDGTDVHILSRQQAGLRLQQQPLLLCHAPSQLARLGLQERGAALDVLELFALLYPAQFVVPTPTGLARYFGLGEGAAASLLHAATQQMLQDTTSRPEQEKIILGAMASLLEKQWGFARPLLNQLGDNYRLPVQEARRYLHIIEQLPQWEDAPAANPPGLEPIDSQQVRQQLGKMLQRLGRNEIRPSQLHFTDAVTAHLQPRDAAEAPPALLAEIGTGTGKTLGYLAPASLWAAQHQYPIWVSTYTRQLQQQIRDELQPWYGKEAAEKLVVRKGRENYLCLLNLDEASRGVHSSGMNLLALVIMTRWVVASPDGDLTSSHFPGWLVDILGRARTYGLADQRGECIYSACPHYQRCFVERNTRAARGAELVVANHALVMTQCANGGIEERGDNHGFYIFDEAHHLFSAADSVFAAHLTAGEMHDLRRWLLGAEASQKSRARGLRKRLEGLIEQHPELMALLDEVLHAASILPADNWRQQLSQQRPQGSAMWLMALIYSLVQSQAVGSDYSLECPAGAPTDDVLAAASDLAMELRALQNPLRQLAKKLTELLERHGHKLDSDNRRRLDAVARGLARRAEQVLEPWLQMLDELGSASETAPPIANDNGNQPVDWFGIERIDGRDVDVGYYRHWRDPTLPFIAAMQQAAQAVITTSASLTDGGDWHSAGLRTGLRHWSPAANQLALPSSFDYAAQSRIIILQDVDKQDMAQLSAAYAALFLAAGGGALGLFTAIARLRAVHQKLAPKLAAEGLPLLAQHVDGMELATLVDIFRNDSASCLLGTDAVRDGVDVPGDALRLLVYDRTPWPQPSLLHKARRAAFGGNKYDDMLTRFRLKQAFGRLLRRRDDYGVMVLLDRALPSRLLTAFPEDVPIVKLGLQDACQLIADFLAPKTAGHSTELSPKLTPPRIDPQAAVEN